MPGRAMSYEYFARPVTLCGPSMRETRVPSSRDFSGHGYFGCCGRTRRRLHLRHLTWSRWPVVSHGVTPFAASAAFSTPMFVPQRQRLPSSARFACSGVGFGRLLEQRHRRHHEARRAEAAHQAVVVAERLLHRMERVALRKAVDRADVLALRFDREHRARVVGAAVDDHRARAAGAAIAHALLAGDVEPRAHRVEQRHARLDAQLMPLAVDRQRDRDLAGPDRRAAPAPPASRTPATTAVAIDPTPTVLKKSRRETSFSSSCVPFGKDTPCLPARRHCLRRSAASACTRPVTTFAARNR